jgi:hypothetical protein
MGTRKTTSFFGKRITDEIEDKKLQPIVLGAANLAAELQDQNLTLILYMAATTHNPDTTKVTATIEYEPEGLLEKTGDESGRTSSKGPAGE